MMRTPGERTSLREPGALACRPGSSSGRNSSRGKRSGTVEEQEERYSKKRTCGEPGQLRVYLLYGGEHTSHIPTTHSYPERRSSGGSHTSVGNSECCGSDHRAVQRPAWRSSLQTKTCGRPFREQKRAAEGDTPPGYHP